MAYPNLIIGTLAPLTTALLKPCSEVAKDESGLVSDQIIDAIDRSVQGVVGDHIQAWTMPEGLLTASNPNSRWRIVSCVQKAIRHGDVDMAMHAAHAAACIDSNYLFRRLSVCSIEDVGIGNLFGVAATMAAMGRKVWRDQLGQAKVAVWLAKTLAEGMKDRLACEFYVWVDFSRELTREKEAWADLSNQELISRMQDSELDWGRRTMAAWLLAGTKKFGGMTMPQTNDRPRQNLMRVYAQSDMPLIMYYLAEMAARRCNENLFISMYAMNEMLRGAIDCTVRQFQVPPVRKLGHLLSAAYDMHTREGKIALGKFVKECSAVNQFLKPIPEREMRDLLIGCGVFCAEGGVLERRPSSPEIDAVYRMAHHNELDYPGLPGEQHAAFLKAIVDNIEELNECRKKVLIAKKS